MYKKIIVFEGIDGSGKTFHLNEVSKYLNKKKIKFIKFREPGGTRNSEVIRNIILSDKSTFKKKTDFLLYLAARNENYESLIKPNINKKVILIDRFIDSTIAYQVDGKKVKRSFIDHLHKFILKGIKPNITFILKVSPKASKLRLKKRKTKNRYDNFSQSFYTKAQKSFLKIAKNKKNYFVLDSSSNTNELEKKIFKIVSRYLKIQ